MRSYAAIAILALSISIAHAQAPASDAGSFIISDAGTNLTRFTNYTVDVQAVYQLNGTHFTVPETTPINLTQFASTVDLNNAVSGINGIVSSLNAQIFAEAEAARTNAALAASLTPLLPTDGKTNELNYAVATMAGKVAFSANYSHLEGDVNFIAAAALSRRGDAVGKIGMGVSW